jgi:hypothetical protein
LSIFSGWSDFPLTVLSSDLKPMGEDRPSGIHLSDVINRMREAEGLKSGGEPDGPLVQLGFVWEQALEYLAGGMTLDDAIELAWKRTAMEMRRGIAKQVRLSKDGIHMTPDGFNETTGEIESYKSTAKSLARAITKDEFESNFWEWQVQEMSYCYALGVDTVRWIVLWRAGDYTKGPGTFPRITTATMTWDVRELMGNWERVLRVAEGLR